MKHTAERESVNWDNQGSNIVWHIYGPAS